MSEEYEPGLVSVIIPTFNRAQMVTEAMDSVWNQTYRPIELIVVDDGSTDDTRDVAQNWGQAHGEDPHFEMRYFYQENRGAPAARNKGAAESKGEFIIWHDSDDVMLPSRIEEAVDSLVSIGADMCCCGLRVIGGGRLIRLWDGVYLPPARSPVSLETFDPSRLPYVIEAWTYRRRFLRREVYWDERAPREQDVSFFWQCVLSHPPPRISSVPRVLCVVRDHRGARISDTTSAESSRYRLTMASQAFMELADRPELKGLYRMAKIGLLRAAGECYRTFPDAAEEALHVARRQTKEALLVGLGPVEVLVWSIGGLRLYAHLYAHYKRIRAVIR